MKEKEGSSMMCLTKRNGLLVLIAASAAFGFDACLHADIVNDGGRLQPSVALDKRPTTIDDMSSYLKWKWRTDVSDHATGLDYEAEAYGGLLSNLVTRVRLWPELAPGETNACRGRFAFDDRNNVWRRHDVTCPELMVFRPVASKSRTLILFLPGGGYMSQHMGVVPTFGRMTLDSGRFYAVLHYRIPRRLGRKIYEAPREDLVRAVRWLRSHAAEFGWSPEAIGTVGCSAGGHLSVISAVSSQDCLYDSVDPMDAVSEHLNFAVAVYPAYVLDDGATGPNAKRGDGAALLPEFKFDTKTPPMLLLHGDDDYYSSIGSVKLYEQLHKRKIPAQLFVYSKANHGLNHNVNVRGWECRIVDWIESMGF